MDLGHRLDDIEIWISDKQGVLKRNAGFSQSLNWDDFKKCGNTSSTSRMEDRTVRCSHVIMFCPN